jgi:general secretion pathway protein D
MKWELAARLACGTLLLWAVAACAPQRIRDEAQLELRSGNYEKAQALLDGGVREYPDSALLRSGSVQARNEAMARLLNEAAMARAAGRLDEAKVLLHRAEPFDTGGHRVADLLADVEVEQRQRAVLTQAQALVDKQQTAAALRLVLEALKDNARMPELQALKRRLEASQRAAQSSSAQAGLSEVRPISLDFRDAGLRTVLDVVTRSSGINFVLDKDIRSDVRVTVFLRSARLEDAIDLITSTNGLSKKLLDSKTVLIYPNTLEKQREYQEQVIRVFHLASAEAKGAAAFLRSMIKVKEPFVDERSNMLALRDSPENIELAERLIALYDTPEPEVVLEVEVLEIRSSRLLDLGVKFPDTFSLTPLGPEGSSSGLTLANIGGVYGSRVAVGIGGLLVNFKREVGDFNTLANPRIRARNKGQAKVLVGDKVPVVTTTTGQGGFVADSVSYLDVGLKLEVEPTVYADDEVAMKIALEVSSVSREVRTNNGTLAYQIGTRNANTILRLRDGETQLLAGLISNEDRSSASRVPGIGDLPLAGRLFSSQRDDSQRTELVLAITPRIVRNQPVPDASQAELWVGTESQTRLRPVGGRIASGEPAKAGMPAAQGAEQDAGPAPGGREPSASARRGDSDRDITLSLKWEGPKEVKAGDEFDLTLLLNSQAAMRGAPIRLSHDPKRLAVLAVEEGDYFKQGGVKTSMSQRIDAQQGRVHVGIIREPLSGTPGQGTVLKLKLKALVPGGAELGVQSFSPVMLGGAQPPRAEVDPYRVLVK